MRPAQRIEPAPDRDPSQSPDEKGTPSGYQGTRSSANHELRRTRRRRMLVRIGVAVAALAVAGGVIRALTGGSPEPARGTGGGSTPTAPARAPFVFHITSVSTDSTGARAVSGARDAAVEIGARLSSFYDAAFMDPTTWTKGLPDDRWLLFDEVVRARAQKDGTVFTLGPQGADLRTLVAKKGNISVEVLLDPRGAPQAALADVVFEAEGTLRDGQAVTVSNQAHLLLRLQDGEWVVYGYPSADTSVDTASPSPSPVATPTASSTGPTP